MNVLLVYPRYPDTFWNFKHALKFISKKAAYPPLGLLTVAALLPVGWNKRLVDMNVDPLRGADLEWADYVFLGAMDIQRHSAREVIDLCAGIGKKVVAGGPLFTTGHDEFEGVDHFVLGEAEATLPAFISDLERGCARHMYRSEEWPDVRETPAPAWGLVDVKKYASLSLQYSRGCPFNCEFCDIVLLNGRTPRTKDTGQLLAEMEAIYRLGWRGGLFMVDDNFIGNKKKLKADTLPAVAEWMKEHHYPFGFITQVSIGLADDEELIGLMVDAGFSTVFIGVETPHEGSLDECGKHQNTNRDMVASIRKLQNRGLQVYGGFIVGFDSDPQNIFERQIAFIQQSGIVSAMVGLLKAPRGTRLYHRLAGENRLVGEMTGDSTDLTLNFVPKMDLESLVSGYKHILSVIYAPRQYYARVGTFMRQHRPVLRRPRRFGLAGLRALLKTVWYIGIRERGQRYYWRLLVSTLLRRPRSFPLAVTMAVYGYHFRKVTDGYGRR